MSTFQHFPRVEISYGIYIMELGNPNPFHWGVVLTAIFSPENSPGWILRWYWEVYESLATSLWWVIISCLFPCFVCKLLRFKSILSLINSSPKLPIEGLLKFFILKFSCGVKTCSSILIFWCSIANFSANFRNFSRCYLISLLKYDLKLKPSNFL